MPAWGRHVSILSDESGSGFSTRRQHPSCIPLIETSRSCTCSAGCSYLQAAGVSFGESCCFIAWSYLHTNALQEDETLKQLQFFSVASDGRVTLWTLSKSELLHQVSCSTHWTAWHHKRCLHVCLAHGLHMGHIHPDQVLVSLQHNIREYDPVSIIR